MYLLVKASVSKVSGGVAFNAINLVSALNEDFSTMQTCEMETKNNRNEYEQSCTLATAH